MRAMIEHLRFAVRNWLNAPSAAERTRRAEIEQAGDQMRESLRRP